MDIFMTVMAVVVSLAYLSYTIWVTALLIYLFTKGVITFRDKGKLNIKGRYIEQND